MRTKHHYPLEPLFGKIIRPFERFLRQTAALAWLYIGARSERGVTGGRSKDCP